MKIFTHPDFTRHNTGQGHPECPERLKCIQEMLHQDFADEVERAFPADDSKLLLAHPQSHIDSILDALPFEGLSHIDGDTVLSEDSFDTALLAVGAVCNAVDAVMDDEAQTAFAAIRPPGHHAEYETAMGFCLFNNVFIGARHAACRTMIIDFDVHHGNGTQDLVHRRVQGGQTDIAYASTHQYPFWPMTGERDLPNICNCPLPQGTGSEDFRKAVTDKIILFLRDFNPELIMFSAGFDAHKDDPLAELNLESEDFSWIVEQVKPICPKIVSVLEGGYNLQTLPDLVKTHLKALSQSD